MFQYKVKYWDDDAMKNLTEVGLVGTDKWGKAAKELIDYYGEANIQSIEFVPMNCVMYGEEVIEAMQEAIAEE